MAYLASNPCPSSSICIFMLQHPLVLQWFYTVHIAMAVLFIGFACMHWARSWMMIFPSVLSVLALRKCQRSAPLVCDVSTSLLALEPDPRASQWAGFPQQCPIP